MNLVRVVGADHGLLVRWADACQRAQFDAVILPIESLRDRSLPAGICLVDLGPRGGAEVAFAERLIAEHPAMRFVTLTARPDAGEGLRLLRSGARGYANRQVSGAVLGALLEAVDAGEIWAGRQVTDFLLQLALDSTPVQEVDVGPGTFAALTGREAEIAARVGDGSSNKVIAADMGISERTVKAHLNNIFRKTGIRNRVQLALAVARRAVPARRLSSG
jgi:DNA-binding NarL/FixJ family response regulator